MGDSKFYSSVEHDDNFQLDIDANKHAWVNELPDIRYWKRNLGEITVHEAVGLCIGIEPRLFNKSKVTALADEYGANKITSNYFELYDVIERSFKESEMTFEVVVEWVAMYEEDYAFNREFTEQLIEVVKDKNKVDLNGHERNLLYKLMCAMIAELYSPESLKNNTLKLAEIQDTVAGFWKKEIDEDTLRKHFKGIKKYYKDNKNLSS